jgi:4-carboxymuconolactone decarboxylase/3-oxoadipate enol-lactonase/4-carboxymuconolactone decarboxylase
MDEQQRREEGMKMRRAILGDAYVDRAVAGTTRFTTGFQDLITRYAWGEIWTRPGLDVATRRVLVIGTMIALGQWDELRLHVRAAVAEGGVSADILEEIVLQQAIYCGVPAARTALGAIRETLDELAARERPRRSAEDQRNES